MYVTNST